MTDVVDREVLLRVQAAISGCGTVAMGRVKRGVVKVGEEVPIVGIRDTNKTKVTGVEMFCMFLDHGQAGNDVGVFGGGVERAQVLCMPGTMKPTTHISKA